MSRPTVLVVDDEIGARTTIINFLNGRFDCEFREAGDGKEAVEYVKSNPCDVIILDIRMPKKGGMSVIREAKIINPGVDILIVSAWVSDFDADVKTPTRAPVTRGEFGKQTEDYFKVLSTATFENEDEQGKDTKNRDGRQPEPAVPATE